MPKLRQAAAWLLLCGASSLAVPACGGSLTEGDPPDADADADSDVDGDVDGDGDGDADTDGDSDGDADGDSDADIDPTGPAYLHANLWSVWWNGRTRCGAEVTFREICRRRGDDCAPYDRAVAACDPWLVVYGQIGPEQQGDRNCSRGRYPDIGGCDTTLYDFDTLRFWWYGAEWSGNWPTATLKIFPGGTTDPTTLLGDGLIAFSNLPGAAQAGMSGISNHGISDSGCAMLGSTNSDEAYLLPFGGFAWIEVPTDAPVAVVAMAATNFGDRPFEGCHRGAATQDPWLPDAPGAIPGLGCVYLQDYHFQPGRHYYWRYGRIEELPTAAPPAELTAGFALPEVGLDITAGCSQ